MGQEMDEHEIETAYARLGTALAPPVDSAQRVERRVADRRRRRRTTVAGGTLLAVAAVGGVTFAALSGDDGSGQQVAVDPPSGLTMTREDGTTYAFQDVDVTCEAPAGEDLDPGGAQRIWAVSPRLIEGDRPTQPFVYFQGIVSKIEGDQTFTFPTDWNMRSDRFPLVLFAMDTDGNEVASSAGGESGTVRVVEAACDPVPVLRLEVDMTLGSEEGMKPLRVTGSLR
jgi:hypothetical protein